MTSWAKAYRTGNIRTSISAFSCCSLIALVAGGWAIYTYVVSSPDPAVRWQTLQMLQVGHFLWPPFLMGGLYCQGMRQVVAQFEALANNLPYFGE